MTFMPNAPHSTAKFDPEDLDHAFRNVLECLAAAANEGSASAAELARDLRDLLGATQGQRAVFLPAIPQLGMREISVHSREEFSVTEAILKELEPEEDQRREYGMGGL